MRLVYSLVLDHAEQHAVRRIEHLLGYCLDSEAERHGERVAVSPLLRRGDSISPTRYLRAIEALRALKGRLEAETSTAVWEPERAWMADERQYQVDLVTQALDALPHPDRVSGLDTDLDSGGRISASLQGPPGSPESGQVALDTGSRIQGNPGNPADSMVSDARRRVIHDTLRQHQTIATSKATGEWTCSCTPSQWRMLAGRSVHLADAVVEALLGGPDA